MKQCFYCLILFAQLQLFSQEGKRINGTVKVQGEAIPGATVRLLDRNDGTTTDFMGAFLIDNLESELYKIEVRSVGYKPYIFEADLTNASSISREIEMKESILDMGEVVVTGTMQPTFVTQSPIKVEVVTAKHIGTYMPTAATGVVESLTLISGVQEVVACGVCFTNSISINGLPGPYTAVLMDGTPMYGNLASVYGLNGIPNMIIDRFEVIKGPNSTLYGSEAVAGVINIITKDPDTQPKFSIDVMGTSHLESFGNMAGTFKMKKVSGYVGLNYAYINDFDDVNDDGFGDIANLDRVSLFTKWNVKRPSKKPFTISAKYYYEDRRNGVEEFIVNRNYRTLRGSDEIYGESIYTNRAELFGTYGIPGVNNLKLDYSLSAHRQNSYYGSDFYKAEQEIAYANLIWSKKVESHQILSGFTSRYQAYDDNTVATEKDQINDPDNQFIPGVFIQDEWEIEPNFTLLTGLRADSYHDHGLIFSPRLSTKTKAGDWTTLRTNFGTGFRVVNLFTEDHAFLSGQREVVITEELKPEKSYNFSINANHIFTLGSSQGSIDIDAFYTYFTNKIIPNYDDQSLIVYENTRGFAVTKGVSVSISQEFTIPLAFNLGLNVQDATETERNTFSVKEKRDIEFAPRWTGVFTSNYKVKKWNMSMAYTLNVTGAMALPEVYDLDVNGESSTLPRPTSSEPFSIHNIQINKNLKSNFSFYLGVQNLLDYTQAYSPLVGYNDPNSNAGFSSSFDTSYAYGPIHGREFYVGINLQLK
ncbi:MAG: TonB-dependent receptor [Cyclobacteriaceae bacterium]